MFTVLMTIVGLVVFIISLFKANLKVAFVRLLMCTGAGLVVDIIIAIVAATWLTVVTT